MCYNRESHYRMDVCRRKPVFLKVKVNLPMFVVTEMKYRLIAFNIFVHINIGGILFPYRQFSYGLRITSTNSNFIEKRYYSFSIFSIDTCNYFINPRTLLFLLFKLYSIFNYL